MVFVAYYTSPLGIMSMTSDGNRLTTLRFYSQHYAPADVLPKNSEEHPDLPVFLQTRKWLDVYFSGQEPDFIPQLLPEGTPFRQAVWKQLLTIPFGQTTTYGEIARRIGCRSAQAVGGAVGHNPIAIIVPCHRVIGSNGTLTGYAAGIDRKAWLLKNEELKKQ